MSSRGSIAFFLAMLAFFGSARADQPPARRAAVKAIVHTAAVTRRIAHVPSVATVAHVAAKAPVPAKLAHAAVAGHAAPTKHPTGKLAEKPSNERHDKAAAPGALCVRAIGRAETGTAAWYGGTYIGRRTSSGSTLDTTHLTAAHRTLPLNSLARVTNLGNGRSVIVRVTDRGPISTTLLIDMSPRAADELQMKHAGLVPVRVEPVVEVAATSK